MKLRENHVNGIEKKLDLFVKRSTEEIDASIRNRRITSPLHWKYYFDPNPVNWEIESQLHEFLCHAKDNPDDAARMLIEPYNNEKENQTFSSKKLLERLTADLDGKSLGNEVSFSIFRILSDVADELSFQSGPRLLLEFDIFMQIEVLVEKLLTTTEPKNRYEVICSTIKNGKAFSWLMFFTRNLMINHRVLNPGYRLGTKWLTQDETDMLCETCLYRIHLDSDRILDSSNPRYILYLWFDIGKDLERERLQNWVEKSTKSNEDFIRFINIFSTIRNTEKGNVWFVQTKFLENLINLNQAISRLEQISKEDSALEKQAGEMLRRFQASKR